MRERCTRSIVTTCSTSSLYDSRGLTRLRGIVPLVTRHANGALVTQGKLATVWSSDENDQAALQLYRQYEARSMAAQRGHTTVNGSAAVIV